MRIQEGTLQDEIAQIHELLSSWKESIDKGVPGCSRPTSEDNIARWEMNLRAELQLCAERLMTLVDLIGEER